MCIYVTKVWCILYDNHNNKIDVYSNKNSEKLYYNNIIIIY